VRDEMALTLADAVLRRLDLGTGGPPAASDLAEVTRVMATELGWDAKRVEREQEQLAGAYR
jgi:glycerol-3-phosphate dehydrogenase